MSVISIGQKTIINVLDGSTIEAQYAKNTSPTTPPTTGWGPSIPPPEIGYYVWKKERMANPDGTFEPWQSPIRITGDQGQKGNTGAKGDTGAKGATGDIGPRGVEGTSITGVTEYYLATTASSGVTTGTAGWGTTLQPMTATKKYLWNYEKIHFSEGDDQPTIPVIIGVYGDKGVTGDTGRAITSIQEKYLVSPNATGIARAGNTWHDTPPATTTTNKYLWNYEIINWSTGTTPTYVEPFVIGVHGATGPKGDQGIQGPKGTTGDTGQTGQTGAPGANAPYLQTQYSINGTTLWHTPFATGDLFMRTNNGTGWSTGMRIVGEDGANGADGQKGIDGSWYKFEFAKNTSTSTPPSTGWRDDPYVIGAGEYSWMRRGLVVPPATTPASWGTSTRITGDKGEQGPQGIQGPMGNPGRLGFSSTGATLYLKGFNTDGSFGASSGIINFGNAQLTIPQASYTFTEVGNGYVILDVTASPIVPKFVKMVLVASTSSYISWRDFNTGTEIAVSNNTNFIVIATFHVEVGLIDTSEIINPVLLNTYIKSHFMDLLNDRQTVTSGNFGLWADAMGVTDVFASIAAYELFVDNLTANTGFIEELGSKNINIKKPGAIYSGYTKEGDPPSDGAGFWLGWSGILKAKFAELIGTLKTGLGASNSARVAIKDDSGIISGPTFTGSGVNDLLIVKDGGVAVNVKIKIERTNVATAVYTPTLYKIGDVGAGGGLIFYVEGSLAYEVGPVESETNLPWGGSGTDVYYLQSDFGQGQANTNKIVSTLGNGNYAAKYCDDLIYNGCDDWFLCSRKEFEKIKSSLFNVGLGNFHNTDPYWVSTQVSYSNAITKSFSQEVGSFSTYPKNDSKRVRPIRVSPSTRDVLSYRYHDTFKISLDNGASYGQEIDIPTSLSYPITGYDITIAFYSRTGHVVGDVWEFKQGSMYGLSIRDSTGNEYIKASNGSLFLNKSNGLPFFTAYDGAVDINGSLYSDTINTGQGATEVHLMNQNLRTTDSPTFASINTGYGANEVYKLSYQAFIKGNITANTVDSIGAMVSGEWRIISVSGGNSNRTYQLKAPSGGTYDVLASRGPDGKNGMTGTIGVVAGGAIILSASSSSGWKYWDVEIIIRKR